MIGLACTRLDRAKLLLETTKWPLARVADRSGLGSAATLARALRRQLGITPEDYRARFRHGTKLKSVHRVRKA